MTIKSTSTFSKLDNTSMLANNNETASPSPPTRRKLLLSTKLSSRTAPNPAPNKDHAWSTGNRKWQPSTSPDKTTPGLPNLEPNQENAQSQSNGRWPSSPRPDEISLTPANNPYLPNPQTQSSFSADAASANSQEQKFIDTAKRINTGHFNLSKVKPRALPNLANVFSKPGVNTKEYEQALSNIATHVKTNGLSSYTEEEITMLANAFAKLPDKQLRIDVLANIAKHVKTNGLSGYTEQGIAKLANAFSWISDKQVRADALAHIAKHVKSNGLSGYTEQGIAMLAKAFSWLPDKQVRIGALAHIAKHVKTNGLNGYTEQGIDMLANAFFELPDKQVHSDIPRVIKNRS